MGSAPSVGVSMISLRLFSNCPGCNSNTDLKPDI